MFTWDPGDGSDVVEGQDGVDTSSSTATPFETIDVAANGGRVRFFRNVGNINMDLDDVEMIDFNVSAGPTSIVVNDLAGTDVTDVVVDLADDRRSRRRPAARQVTADGTNGTTRSM